MTLDLEIEVEKEVEVKEEKTGRIEKRKQCDEEILPKKFCLARNLRNLCNLKIDSMEGIFPGKFLLEQMK